MVSLSSILRPSELSIIQPLTTNIVNPVSETPLINEELWAVNYGVSATPKMSYKLLWRTFKDTPEMVALFTTIVEDILSDGWKLYGGRNAKIEAEEFLEKNKAKQVIASFLYDGLVTGDGYLYKSKLSEKQVNDVVKKAVSRIRGSPDIKMTNGILARMREQHSVIFKPRTFKSIAASSVLANFDIHGEPLQYVQTVGAKQAVFTPDEIIHWPLMNLDGKFYGFTPMTAVMKEIAIIANIKDYAKYFFEQGGVPNFMFILKNESPDSPTHKSFKRALRLYANLTNKYKSLVLTGDVEAKELNRMNKDMEYRELARYMTQILVMTWGVPASRLSDVLVTQGMKSSVTSSEGYYRKISHYQDILEDIINSQLLIGYKVKLRFNRTYKQDEVREVQIEKMKTDIVQQRMSLGLVNEAWSFDYLDIPEQFRGDPSAKEKEKEEKSNLENQELNKLQELNESEDKVFDNKQKQSSAIKNKT